MEASVDWFWQKILFFAPFGPVRLIREQHFVRLPRPLSAYGIAAVALQQYLVPSPLRMLGGLGLTP